MSIPVSVVPKIVVVARFFSAVFTCKGDLHEAAAFADREWRDTPQVAATLRLIKNAAVSPLDTNSPLAPYGILATIIELLLGASVYERLRGFFRRVPFRSITIRELAAADVQWVPSGGTIYGTAMQYDNTFSLPEYKIGGVVVYTDELARVSRPGAEESFVGAVIRAIAKFQDEQFLDPSISLVAGTNPASVSNGGQSVTSTGSSSAQILTDLTAMCAKLGSWNEPRWIMKPSTAAAIAASSGTLFPQIKATPDGGFLLGIPVLNSTNSPGQIVLLDAADIAVADDGRIEIMPSRQSSVDLDDGGSPSVIRTANLWHENLVGLRFVRMLSWLRAHSDGVVSMTVSY